MSATPYSDAWRERTRERMARLDTDAFAVGCKTGLFDKATDALEAGDVSHEISGPIDTMLDELEDQAEAAALELPDVVEVQPGNRRRPHFARRVDVCLDAITNCDVVLHGEAGKR